MTEYYIQDLIPVNDPAAGFPLWDAHPLAGGFAHRLYPTVAPGHVDHSFQVVGPSGPLVLVRCSGFGPDISLYGLPLVLAAKQGLSPREEKKALSQALDHLKILGQRIGATRAIIGGAVQAEADILAALCIDRQAKGETKAWIVADLAQDLAVLKRDVRDSYRSLINWGERNITLRSASGPTAERAVFDLFPAFHAQVSGRERGARYWDVYWQEILSGQAELLLGWLADGTLVSGSIVVGAGQTAYYASGVYARDQFDKPLGHWPLWQAMVRAKAAGYRWFDAGEIADHWQSSDKESNIAFFKRGFSSRRLLRMQWLLSLL